VLNAALPDPSLPFSLERKTESKGDRQQKPCRPLSFLLFCPVGGSSD